MEQDRRKKQIPTFQRRRKGDMLPQKPKEEVKEDVHTRKDKLTING